MTEHDEAAGNAFRENLVARADYDHCGCPMWYGWAIMEAFLAGAAHARADLRTKAALEISEEMVERAAKAHYEDYFSSMENLEPEWAASKHEGRVVDPSYWHRMRSAMRAALTAALKGE